MKAVGARVPRYDGVAHVTARTQFVQDGCRWCRCDEVCFRHIVPVGRHQSVKRKRLQRTMTNHDQPPLRTARHRPKQHFAKLP